MVLSQTFMVLLVGHGSMGMSPLLFMVCCWKDVFNWQHTTQVMLGRSNEGDFNNQPSLLSQYSNILTVCWGPFIICCWLSNDLTVYLVAKNIHKIVASIPFWGVEKYQFKPHWFGFLWEYDTSKWSSFSSSFRNEHALFGLYQTPYQYIWVNYNDLTATSLGIMVSKGNHISNGLNSGWWNIIIYPYIYIYIISIYHVPMRWWILIWIEKPQLFF